MDSVLDITLTMMEIVLLLVLLILIIMDKIVSLARLEKYGMVNHALVDVLMGKYGIILLLPAFVLVD